MEMKERILHAERIGIWISPRATKTDVQLAHTMACALTKLEKRVRIVSQTPAGANTFSVTLRGLAPRIGQVAYEKAGEDLKLHFTLQRGELSPENVSLEVASQTDLTIIVGDNNAQYNYRKIHAFILELLLNHAEASFRLLGTTLFRLEQPPIDSLYTITLTLEDFRTVLAAAKDIPLVVQDLKEQFGNESSWLFLLEQPSGDTQALLWTSQPQLSQRLASEAPTRQKGNWTLWTPAKPLAT